MPTGQRVAAELPDLRRYARAVTGSQTQGDQAVKCVLEAVLAGEPLPDDQRALRLALFKMLHHPAVLPLNSGTSPALREVTPHDQRAMLLTSVLGLSVAECSQILDVPVDELRVTLERAHNAVAAGLRSRILVIEDEGVIAMHIRMIVEEAGHDVVGVARTRSEAVDMAAALRPEVVLADISLGDGSSGIDAVSDILEEMATTVIFVTAFPERLLTGERLEPTFLVPKPFEPLMLTATIAQAILTERNANESVH